MIIFSLEALADDSHRRHFIDPSKSNNEYMEYAGFSLPGFESGKWYNDQGKPYQPDWQGYYDACDGDKPIKSVIDTLYYLFNMNSIEIWSNRCESMREKTIKWLEANTIFSYAPDLTVPILKLRPIGDNSPAHELKERWLEYTYEDTKWGARTPVEFVFESDPQSIQMFRKHGIFTFDCNQGFK